MDSKVPIAFRIFQGDNLVREEKLEQDIIKIGKLQSSHLRLDDDGVSRMHAVIEVANANDVSIIDLGSAKGTIVNGRKVNKAKLQSGDELLLGETRIVVLIGAAAGAVSSPSGSSRAPAAAGYVAGAPAVSTSTIMASALPPPGMDEAPSPAAPSPPAARRPTPAVTSPPIAAALPRPPAASGASGSTPVAYGGSLPTPPPGAQPSPMSFAPLAPFGGSSGSQPGARGAAAWSPEAAYAAPEAVEALDGSRAVEVVALFGDEVVSAVHLTRPNPKSGRGLTLAIGVTGAVALLAAAGLFFGEIRATAVEKQAFEEWQRANKPVANFPWQPSNPGKGAVVTLALMWSVTAALWFRSRRWDERSPSDFTIGTDDGVTVPVSGAQVPTTRFAIVKSTGDEFVAQFTSTMGGDVTVPGQPVMPLDGWVQAGRARPGGDGGSYETSIPRDGRIRLTMGDTSFVIASVAAPRRFPVPVQVDWNQQLYNGISLAVHALLLLMMFSIPPDPKSLSLDLFANDNRLIKYAIKPQEEKEEKLPAWLKNTGDKGGGKGERHKGDEGKMGKKTSKNKSGLYGLKGPKDNPDPHLAKELADKEAKEAGILGILKKNEGSHIASIFGRDSALGQDAENVLGGLTGNKIGEAYGEGGLGLAGTGRGGGGTGEGTVGLGRLGTIGKGGGGGDGSGYGRGVGGLASRRAKAPDVIPGTAQVRGSLDKEIIRRVIRRHINEVKYCYEKELVRFPDLYGRVMVQFTIDPSGRVVASVVQSSTMNNATVDQCIASSVTRWEFPKPQGGGIVVVTYPFVLKASSGE